MPLALVANELNASFALACAYALSGRVRVRLYRTRPGADCTITPQVLKHLGNDMQKGRGQVMDYTFRDVFMDSDFIKEIHVFTEKVQKSNGKWHFKKTRIGPPPACCEAAGMVLSAYDWRILEYHFEHLLDTFDTRIISTYTDSITVERHEGMDWHVYQTKFSPRESLHYNPDFMGKLPRGANVRVRKYWQDSLGASVHRDGSYLTGQPRISRENATCQLTEKGYVQHDVAQTPCGFELALPRDVNAKVHKYRQNSSSVKSSMRLQSISCDSQRRARVSKYGSGEASQRSQVISRRLRRLPIIAEEEAPSKTAAYSQETH